MCVLCVHDVVFVRVVHVLCVRAFVHLIFCAAITRYFFYLHLIFASPSFFRPLLQHAGNILRLFIITGAMLISAVESYLFLSLRLTLAFWFSVGLVGVAIQLYYKPVKKPLSLADSLSNSKDHHHTSSDKQ